MNPQNPYDGYYGDGRRSDRNTRNRPRRSYTGQNPYSPQNGYSSRPDYPQSDGYPSRTDYPQADEYPYQPGYSQPDGYPSQTDYPMSDGYSDRNGYDDRYGNRARNNYAADRNYAGRSAGGGYGNERSRTVRPDSVRPAVNRADGRTGRTGFREPDEYEPRGGYGNGNTALLYVGIGVALLAVVLIAVSVTILNSRNKDNQQTAPLPVVSDSSRPESATVVGFDDSDEDEPETTQTTVAYVSLAGKWRRTDVYESQKATFTAEAEEDGSFSFTLKIWSDDKTVTITGSAVYVSENTAVYKESAASITFEKGSQYLSVYHSGKNKAFGIAEDFVIDGKFTQKTPKYIEKEDTAEYDYQIYQTGEVVKALSDTLSADDYALYREMMSKGLKSPIAYERTLDKNGKKVNVDSELNAVKYYAHLSGNASDMIFICSNDAKIYVLFYDAQEMRYYTNDKKYASKMPASFQAVEKASHLKAVFR